MKILLISIGTRGDIEPFLAIGEILNNSTFKKNAAQVADQMKKEDFKEELYNSIVE